MLEIIKKSSLDNEKLSQIKEITNNNQLDSFDFSEAVVKKPWGYEYIAYSSEEISAWILHIKKDNLTSMHCHVLKKTALIVLSGKAVCSTLDKSYELSEGQGLIFDKGVFHSTKAISDNGIILIELESPSKKTDLVRLNDSYGRETKGYELQNEMCFDLSEYERVYFKKEDISLQKRIGNMNLCIRDFIDTYSLQAHLKANRGTLLIILSGEIFNEKNDEILVTGHELRILHSQDAEHIKIKQPVKTLSIITNILDFD